MKTGYKVGEIMNPSVIIAEPSWPVDRCARKMAEEKVGCLVILDEKERVTGIVTEQDLVRKVMVNHMDFTTLVEKVMSTTILSVSSGDDIYDAIRLMGINSIKHLPVLDKGRLVGIITSKDIVATEPALLELLVFKSTSSNKVLEE